MADFKDPEKEQSSRVSSSVDHASTPDVEKVEFRTSSSHTDSASSNSIHSDHSDPLAPLEGALSGDQRSLSEKLGHQLTQTKTGASGATTGSRPADFEVDFTENDPEDPRNWPMWRKAVTIGFVSWATWTVVLYSTSYTSSMPGMMAEFHETSEPIATLGVTTYLLGLAAGSLILAPLSEIYGRRPVYIGSLLFYCIMVLPCALATGLAEVIVVRFFGALAGAAMLSNSPGTVSDLVTEEYRALAFSIWSIGPMNGPVTGPLIGGFAAQFLGWRWTNWLVMIFSGVGWIMCATIPESYAPVILQKKAARMRKEMDDDRYWSRYDDRVSPLQILKTNMTRPITLTLTEPILWFWDAYIGVIYAILYLCFIAYPLIYTGMRGWGLGITGLSFVGIGVGTMLAIVSEPLARRLINAHKKDPATGRAYPESAACIVCIGAVLCPIGQLWFSWTSVPITIHWIWPILAGVPFGAGNCLIFIYASNYIAGCYGIYAASALAGNSVVRSFLGGTLPLAGTAMYTAMTPQWAGTLLGVAQVVLIPIPVAFYFYGAKIRARSPLIRSMREDQERNEKRALKARRANERRLAAERGQPLEVDEAAEIERKEKRAQDIAVPLTHTISS